MPGRQLTQSEYALQCTVESFGNLLLELQDQRLTHIYEVVFCFCEAENINYLVLRYLNTRALPYEEFSKDWLQVGEI